MAAPSGTARFAAGKALSVTAEKNPARVYPFFDAIAARLSSDSKVVCWNAMRILAALAGVDSQRKVDALLDRYLAFIRGGNLISAANAIRGAGRIALARPDLLNRIVPAILEVERASFETPECRNVAIGQALQALRPLGASVHSRADVAGFIRRQKSNPRTAVAACAEELTADMKAGV
ncbi:MAG: hypothetical protein HRF50_00840 [Phycisphaerae bacterium]|jgi:hypothetical protein